VDILGDAGTKIWMIRPNSPTPREIWHSWGRLQSIDPVQSPDGKMLALIDDADLHVWDAFCSLIVIDPESGKLLLRVTIDTPINPDNSAPVWSRDSKSVYAVVLRGGFDQIYRFDLSGKELAVTSNTRRSYNMVASPDGQTLGYLSEDGYGGREIRTMRLENHRETVVAVLDQPEQRYRLGEFRRFTWQSGAIRPNGFLVLPANFSPGKFYPLIVDVHGGGLGARIPMGGFFSFDLNGNSTQTPLEWHAWAAKGYVVFVPDFRSSGEYGAEAIHGVLRSGRLDSVEDVADIEAGIEAVLKEGYVDPARIVLFGHSAGGPRVHLMLTRSSRYAAALLHESIPVDAESTLRWSLTWPNVQVDELYALSTELGPIVKYPEHYKSNTLFDSYKITTPTLLMRGSLEYGGIGESGNEVIFGLLHTRGIPVELLQFLKQGHTFTDPRAARFAMLTTEEWLLRYVGAAKSVGETDAARHR